MLRNILLPIAAASVLAGCITTDYGYRGGRGDYYYGQPSTEYRYYGGYYGGYGYPYAQPYGYYRYSYGYPYYGYPYSYPRYYYRQPVYPGYPYTQPRPPATHQPGSDDRPAWRNFDELRRRRQGPGGTQAQPQQAPRMAPQPTPEMAMPRPMAEPRQQKSRMAEMYRQRGQGGDRRREGDEP